MRKTALGLLVTGLVAMGCTEDNPLPNPFLELQAKVASLEAQNAQMAKQLAATGSWTPDHFKAAAATDALALRPFHIVEWLDAHPNWGPRKRISKRERWSSAKRARSFMAPMAPAKCASAKVMARK